MREAGSRWSRLPRVRGRSRRRLCAILPTRGVRRVAIANPAHAPYGLAAKQALESGRAMDGRASHKLVYGENVQQAVQFVRSGSAEAGIVARSVADTPDFDVALVDERLHAPLNQVAVVLARTKSPRRRRRSSSSSTAPRAGP